MTANPMTLLKSVALAAGLAALPSPAAGQMAEYQVELRFTGYSGLAAGPDCDSLANLAGYDVLTGTVTGMETSGPDDDITYTGSLKRTTAMDFCQTRGKNSPNDDEVVWCIATLTGTAVMDVEIEVYGEADRGAWVKAEPGTGTAQGAVTGNCNPADMREIQRDYPSGESGGSPSGQPIEDVRATDSQGRSITFFAGGHARLRVGTYPPDPAEGGWTLKVIRKIR